MINKKILLVGSGTLSLSLLVWNYIGNYRICDFFIKAGSATDCPYLLTSVGLNLLPIIPLFLLSLITYKMRDEVYKTWLRFTYVWISLSIVLVFLAPEYSADWMFPVAKGTVAFFSSLLFVAISLALIIWKYIALRRTGR